MLIEIKSIAGILLWSGEAASLRAGIEAAVLRGANLRGAALAAAVSPHAPAEA